MRFDCLSEELLLKALALWDLPEIAEIRLINISENLTYLVEAKGTYKSILRVHRPGYRSQKEIVSELLWLAELQAENLISVPTAVNGINGSVIQNLTTVTTSKQPMNLVLFEFIDGSHPEETEDQQDLFCSLGQMAATLHIQNQRWLKPDNFYRQHWNLETIFGAKPLWGKWQSAPGISGEILSLLKRAEVELANHLLAFGTNKKNYGLIHADMRLANLLVKNDQLTLIDFDDCGFGWYLYDFAASASFMENHPQLKSYQQAWIEGYNKISKLSKYEERMLDSFVMMRRLALLAWVGSHAESDEPRRLAPYFATETAELAESYLTKTG